MNEKRPELKKWIQVGIGTYIAFIAVVFILIILPTFGPCTGCWIDFSRIFFVLGIGLILLGAIILGIYIFLVKSYGQGRKTFNRALLSISTILVVIICIYFGNKMFKDYKIEQQNQDFTYADTLEFGGSQQLKKFTDPKVDAKLILHIPKDGTLKIICYGKSRGAVADLYNEKKKYIVKNQTFPVVIQNVKKGETYFLVVTRTTSYVDQYVEATID